MSIADWLPQNPMLGPPLPHFLGILWPWKQSMEIVATQPQHQELSFPDGFDSDTLMPNRIVVRGSTSGSGKTINVQHAIFTIIHQG